MMIYQGYDVVGFLIFIGLIFMAFMFYIWMQPANQTELEKLEAKRDNTQKLLSCLIDCGLAGSTVYQQTYNDLMKLNREINELAGREFCA